MALQIRRRRTQEVESEEARRRRKLRQQERHHDSHSKSSLKSCVQFMVMSAVIPLLFFLRGARDDEDSILRRYQALTVPQSMPEPFAFLPDLLMNYATEVRQQISELDHEWLDSDVAELHHCRALLSSKTMSWTNFTTWAAPLVNVTRGYLLQHNVQTSDVLQELLREITLELLENYATHFGYCNFQRYRPTWVQDGQPLMQASLLEVPPGHARLAFVIAIHQRHDIQHFERLLQAIHMPHHYIVVHIDNHTPETTRNQYMELAEAYDNVVLVQFGNIVDKRTTHVHLKLMRWLTIELGLKFDYHITLDGATFPLLPAPELAQYLYKSSRSVWLGALTEKGNVVHESQRQRLNNKRLATTSVPQTVQLGAIFSDHPATLPPETVASSGKKLRSKIIHPYNFMAETQKDPTLFSHKTTSGETAIFSKAIVRELLSNPKASQIFALTKYGCCSDNLDQYSWMAAVQMLERSKTQQQEQSQQMTTTTMPPSPLTLEAKTMTSMFQLWGGDVTGNCDNNDSINPPSKAANGILTMDANRCYRIEHARLVRHFFYNNTAATHDNEEYWSIPRERQFVHGGTEILKLLEEAPKIGFLFARSFDSQDPQSVGLLDQIQKSWKESDPT